MSTTLGAKTKTPGIEALTHCVVIRLEIPKALVERDMVRREGWFN